MKRSFWFGLAVSAVLLVVVFQSADFAKIGAALAGADYAVLAAGIAVYLLTMGIRAVRWQQLLAPVKPIGFWPLCSAIIIGLMCNNLLPARGGEFLRGYIVGRRVRLPFSATFATIVVERLLDGISFLLLAFIVVLFFPASPDWLRIGGYLAAAMYLGLLAFLGLLAARPAPALRLANAVLRFLPTPLAALVNRSLTAFVDGLSILRQARRLALAGLYSLPLWFSFGITTFTVARSLRLEVSFFAAFVVLVGIGIAVTLPSAPGYIGTTQLFSVLALGLFGVSADDALSFSILYQAAYSLPTLAIGLICLALEGLSFGDLRRGIPPAVAPAPVVWSPAGRESGNS